MQMTLDFAERVDESVDPEAHLLLKYVKEHGDRKRRVDNAKAFIGKKKTIEEKFREFDEANPHIYKAFVRLAFEAFNRGRNRISADMLVHRIRWDLMMNTTDADYRINNNWSSRLARKAIAEHPEFEGLFELRTLHS